MHRR
jgi:hypothetical protein